MSDIINFLKTRLSVKPRDMNDNGPTESELETILTLGARVPDHGKLAPWRFIVFQGEARERARMGMMQGDERFLGPRDKGPQRRFVRDYVDARFSLGEFLIPAMLVVLLMTFLPAQYQMYSLITIWAYLGISVLDAVLLGITLKRKLTAKFGAQNLQPGYRWYAAMRTFTMRRMRLPKPQVRRGERPE